MSELFKSFLFIIDPSKRTFGQHCQFSIRYFGQLLFGSLQHGLGSIQSIFLHGEISRTCITHIFIGKEGL